MTLEKCRYGSTEGFVFIQLLNCSQPKGMTGVDPKCEMVILKSYFTESWQVGGTWNLSTIREKKWIPSVQRHALHETQLL